MKKVKLLLFSVVLLIAIVIAILSCTSKIQDVTLATNDIFEFNEGWQLEKENTTLNIECLPYYVVDNNVRFACKTKKRPKGCRSISKES